MILLICILVLMYCFLTSQVSVDRNTHFLVSNVRLEVLSQAERDNVLWCTHDPPHPWRDSYTLVGLRPAPLSFADLSPGAEDAILGSHKISSVHSILSIDCAHSAFTDADARSR